MLTKTDLAKIHGLLKQELAGQDQRFDQKLGRLDQKLGLLDKRLNKKLVILEKNVRGYVIDGVADIVERLDETLQGSSLDRRVSALERIHPAGQHTA